MQLKVKDIIEHKYFSQAIVILILVNTLILAIDHYGMSDLL